LEHVDTGITTTLLVRVGSSITNSLGCGGNNIDIVLDDSAVDAVGEGAATIIQPTRREVFIAPWNRWRFSMARAFPGHGGCALRITPATIPAS
jgi:hypothetical protein